MDLVGNHIVGFPTRRLIFIVSFRLRDLRMLAFALVHVTTGMMSLNFEFPALSNVLKRAVILYPRSL